MTDRLSAVVGELVDEMRAFVRDIQCEIGCDRDVERWADRLSALTAEAVTVDQAMIERAVDACIQSKGE